MDDSSSDAEKYSIEKMSSGITDHLLTELKNNLDTEKKKSNCFFRLRGVCSSDILDAMTEAYTNVVFSTISGGREIFSGKPLPVDAYKELGGSVAKLFRDIFSGNADCSEYLLKEENNIQDEKLYYLFRVMFEFDFSNKDDINVDVTFNLLKRDIGDTEFYVTSVEKERELRNRLQWKNSSNLIH